MVLLSLTNYLYKDLIIYINIKFKHAFLYTLSQHFLKNEVNN